MPDNPLVQLVNQGVITTNHILPLDRVSYHPEDSTTRAILGVNNCETPQGSKLRILGIAGTPESYGIIVHPEVDLDALSRMEGKERKRLWGALSFYYSELQRCSDKRIIVSDARISREGILLCSPDGWDFYCSSNPQIIIPTIPQQQ